MQSLTRIIELVLLFVLCDQEEEANDEEEEEEEMVHEDAAAKRKVGEEEKQTVHYFWSTIVSTQERVPVHIYGIRTSICSSTGTYVYCTL